MDNNDLYKAIKHYANEDYVNFHTPGHCQGEWVEEKLKKMLGEDVFKADLTELPGLDNISFPESSLKKAEKLASKTFNSDVTRYLVNGATAGIVASILSTVKNNENVLIPRNAHKSVYSGIILSGAKPVYIPLKRLYNGFSLNIDKDSLTTLLQKYSGTVLMLTNPSYFGVCIDLLSIRREAGKDRVMIVDEAHGAHLSLTNKLPLGASESAADIWVQGIHKNLGSLTQSAMLHWKETNVDSFRIQLMLQLLQSTSPSYLLLLSLELARESLEKYMYLWDDFIERVNTFRERISKISGVKLLGYDLELAPEFLLDTTKVTLFTGELGLTGYEAADILRKDYKILVELAGVDHILFYLTPAHTNNTLNYLYDALSDISSRYFHKMAATQPTISTDIIPRIPRNIFTPAQALEKKAVHVDINEAVGKVSANFVVPYPPGTPILVPGELITAEIIEYINKTDSIKGSYLEGIYRHNNKSYIKVVQE